MTTIATTILAAFTEEAESRRRSTYAKYVELLTNPEAADDPKSLTALRQAATALGKTAAAVKSDAAVLSAVRARRQRIAAAAGAPAAMATALAAVQAYDAETAELVKERRKGYFRLYAEYERLSNVRRLGSDAERDLNKLIAEHPELLAGEEPGKPE